MCHPNPVNAPRASHAVAVHRKVFCSHYDQCLNLAVEKNWDGFACTQCGAYRPPYWSKSEWIEDTARCRALVGAVLCPEAYDLATSF